MKLESYQQSWKGVVSLDNTCYQNTLYVFLDSYFFFVCSFSGDTNNVMGV